MVSRNVEEIQKKNRKKMKVSKKERKKERNIERKKMGDFYIVQEEIQKK